MTNHADQEWPEEMTYELTISASSTDDTLLGSNHSVRTVVESAEEQVTELIDLVNDVMEVR